MPHDVESWFHKYSDELFRWSFYKTSSREIAEDLVQETFLAAVKNHKNFEEKASAKTWLFSILNHKIIDYYRKKVKSITVDGTRAEQNFVQQTDSHFDAHQRWTLSKGAVLWEEESHLLDNMEFRKVMGSCMAELPENWRLVITSKYLLNKKGQEICQELKVTPSNYWQMVHRAKLMLKKCIDRLWKR
ncbi:sigma-70 family RNA polymerase sigma factor [Flavobacteriaceae bacterium 3-367]|uniref:sigma-70 family RNA polymerase sigma factor n=1 Tax=Eudoraea algarum TaxID=3417568 RepID=UPI00328F2AE7